MATDTGNVNVPSYSMTFTEGTPSHYARLASNGFVSYGPELLRNDRDFLEKNTDLFAGLG